MPASLQNATGIPDKSYAAFSQVLHEEIHAFYKNIHANGTESVRREDAIARITKFLQTKSSRGRRTIQPYGSFLMGTFLPSSDIDVAVTVRSLRPKRASPDRFNQAAWLANLRRRLVNTPDCGFTVVEFRKNAKEPLLIVRDVATQIEMDITCAHNEIGHNGLERSLWIVSQLPTYKNLVALVVILKDLLRLNVLSDVRSGGFSSYVLTLMLLGFLQRSDNNRNLNLGDLLLKCLKFYGSDFDYTKNAIVVTDGGKIISKKDMQVMVKEPIEQGPYLCIQQPTDPAMDAAKSSCKGTLAVQEAFRRTYDRLMGMVGTSAVNGKDILHTAFA